MKKHLIILAAVAAAVLAAYSHTLHFPFIFDDGLYIVGNPEIKDLSNFAPRPDTRYLGYLSFALNYAAGGLDPAGYRAVNIAIHVLNSVLVYLLALTVAGRAIVLSGRDPKEGGAAAAAMAAAALFALHPVQTQAVTYITQRFASLATFFYLLSVVSYLNWRAAGRLPRASFIVSLASGLLAQFTKEIAFTLPAVIALLELALFTGPVKARARALLPFLLLFLVIPLTLLAPEAIGSGGSAMLGEETRQLQIKQLERANRYEYLITQFRAVTMYLGLMAWPVGQNLDYDFRLSSSLMEPGVLASFLFLLAVFTAGAVLAIRGKGLGLAAGLGILWFFVTASVESSVIPIYDVVFEHRVYLPGVGALMAFGALLSWAASSVARRAGVSAFAAAAALTLSVALPLGAAAYSRNLVWKDGVTMWSDVAAKSPGKPRAHNNLGHALFAEGRMDEAIAEFEAAVRLDPLFAEAYYNAGNALLKKGMPMEAAERYRRALSIKAAYPEAHYNLAMAYKDMGLMDEAITEFRAAVEADPGKLNARNNLTLALVIAGRPEEAVREALAALEIQPSNATAHNNLGQAYMALGRLDEAEAEFAAAIEARPGFNEPYGHLERLRLRRAGR